MFVYYKTNYLTAFEILRKGFDILPDISSGLNLSKEELIPYTNEMVLTLLLDKSVIQDMDDSVHVEYQNLLNPEKVNICEVKWQKDAIGKDV